MSRKRRIAPEPPRPFLPAPPPPSREYREPEKKPAENTPEPRRGVEWVDFYI